MKLLTIADLERAWEEYLDALDDDTLTSIGILNLSSWMGERMGLALGEIHLLRKQLEPGTVTVLIQDGELSSVAGLPSGWDYKVDC